MSDTSRPRRSRKSIAFMPSTPAAGEKNKENPLSAITEDAVKPSRKSRSKSLGPGGLDALNAASGARGSRGNKDNGIGGGAGRRTSLAPALAPKSILKPTLPLSPLQPIPAHRPRAPPAAAPMPSLNFNPTPTTIPVRTEEEQQRRSEILAARATRRQSLGNRRVSFAPEATLHTWDVVEYYRGDDGSSTPSSSVSGSSRASTPASNNDKRNDVTATPTPAPQERPSTPEDQTPQRSSPPSARTEHQKKNRRASLTAFGGAADEVFSSSPISSNGDVERSPFGGDGSGGSDSDDIESSSEDEAKSVGERTFMTAAGETTMGDMSNMSMRLDMDETTRLNPFFKKPTAWRMEGDTEGLEFVASPSTAEAEKEKRIEEQKEVEEEGVTMDITRPLGGMILSDPPSDPPMKEDAWNSSPRDDMDDMTMDITRPIGGLLSASSGNVNPTTPQQMRDEEDMTMDITKPIGGLLSASSGNVGSTAPQQMKQDEEDVTMDITKPIGGLLSASSGNANSTTPQQMRHEEDMTMGLDMDMTCPIGGIISNAATTLGRDKRKSLSFASGRGDEDMTMGLDMDITRPIGGILSAASDDKKEKSKGKGKEEDMTMGLVMDITRPIGGILSPAANTRSRRSLGSRADQDDMTMDMTRPLGGILSNSVARQQVTSQVSDDEKMEVDSKIQSEKKPPSAEKPKTQAKNNSAITTPVRSKFGHSAKKRSGKKISPLATSPPANTQTMTPIKGVGIDKPGLGSPRVAAILSRRKSLGEDSPRFSPVTTPRDLIKVRKEEKEREKVEENAEQERRRIEEENMDLKQRIGLLTPRKAGRKSVAFGFSGIGGKRERDEELGAVDGRGKRRRSMESKVVEDKVGGENPVYTGRITRSRKSLENLTTLPTPGSAKKQTPRKKVVMDEPAKPAEPAQPEKAEEEDIIMEESEAGEEKISLQQFLKSTGLCFLDGLATTKRRQTGFVGARGTGSAASNEDVDTSEETSLGDCVFAGACTVPMLDLFQHSCRELKKYIKEGEAIVNEIEQNTLEETPLLFKEYMCAPPDIKVIMDTQFRDVKTHARFLAKGIWYDWRMKLLDGVRDALESNLKGLKDDEIVLKKQRELIEPVLPGLKEKFEQKERMLKEHKEMKRRVELDDQTELESARKELVDVQRRMEEIKLKLVARREDVAKIQGEIEAREKKKQGLKKVIEEGERIKELNRQFTKDEVDEWRSKVRELERKHGWSLENISPDGKVIYLLCMNHLLLGWDASKNSWNGEYLRPLIKKPSDPKPMGDTESAFFVDALRKWLTTHAAKVGVRGVIKVVGEYWRNVLSVLEEAVKIHRIFPTKTSISSSTSKANKDAMNVDEKESISVSEPELRITARLIIAEIRAKLEVTFAVKVKGSEWGLQVEIESRAKVLYGGVNEEKVNAWLKSVGLDIEERGAWRVIVEEVRGRCIEGRRRAGVGIPVKMG